MCTWVLDVVRRLTTNPPHPIKRSRHWGLLEASRQHWMRARRARARAHLMLSGDLSCGRSGARRDPSVVPPRSPLPPRLPHGGSAVHAASHDPSRLMLGLVRCHPRRRQGIPRRARRRGSACALVRRRRFRVRVALRPSRAGARQGKRRPLRSRPEREASFDNLPVSMTASSRSRRAAENARRRAATFASGNDARLRSLLGACGWAACALVC